MARYARRMCGTRSLSDGGLASCARRRGIHWDSFAKNVWLTVLVRKFPHVANKKFRVWGRVHSEPPRYSC